MRWEVGRYYPLSNQLGVICQEVTIKCVCFKVIFSKRKAQKINFWHDIPEGDPKAYLCGTDWDIEFPLVYLQNAHFDSEFAQLRYLKTHLHLDVTIDLSCEDEKCVTQELLRGFAKQGAIAYVYMTFKEFEYEFLEILI